MWHFKNPGLIKPDSDPWKISAGWTFLLHYSLFVGNCFLTSELYLKCYSWTTTLFHTLSLTWIPILSLFWCLVLQLPIPENKDAIWYLGLTVLEQHKIIYVKQNNATHTEWTYLEKRGMKIHTAVNADFFKKICKFKRKQDNLDFRNSEKKWELNKIRFDNLAQLYLALIIFILVPFHHFDLFLQLWSFKVVAFIWAKKNIW